MANTAENAVHAIGGLLQGGKAFQRIVFAVLGLFLVVTALLKVQGSADGSLGQNAILLSPRLRFAVIEVEAILGLWLLSGWAKRTAWFFAVAFFLAVAGFSFYLGLIGQSSCGCFGRIHVSPWSAFALDMACLVILGLCRPSFPVEKAEAQVHSLRLRDALSIICGTGVILAVCLGGILWAGSRRPGDFLARVRGDRIAVEPAVTDMGLGVAGQKRGFTVRLHNHTDHTVRVVGGTTSCSCIVTDDLPVSIPPGDSEPVTIRAGFKGTPGLFQQVFVFYTDDKDQDRILARFEGRIAGYPDDKSDAASKE